jgi:hypothetical protein
MNRVLLMGIIAWLLAPCTLSIAAASDSGAALLKLADAAVMARQFDKALDLYLRSYQAGQKTPAVRERIHDCLRQSAQHKRHRDPVFRAFVLSLTVSDSLTLYSEIIRTLSTHHADREAASPERLFALGLVEIERAISDAAFRKQSLPQASDAKLAAFRKSLQTDWPNRTPKSPRECRAAMQELVRTALSDLTVNQPVAIVLEAICGAAGGLDEATTYLPPPPEHAPPPMESAIAEAAITDPMAGVGTMAITHFRDSTPAEFDAALARLQDAGMRSLILDLRGNSGGSLAAALHIAERFIPHGVLASTVGQLAEVDGHSFHSTSGMTAIAVPLVILVDGRTMSAAEVLAAAIKDSGRGTIIGTTTFGKGTIQSPVALHNGVAGNPKLGSLMITIAKVISPSGRPLNGEGVIPNIVEPEPALQTRLAGQHAAALADRMRE